jgi:hypothetical protein
MKFLINTALSAVWPQICELRKLSTPDAAVGKSFTVVSFDQSSVDITTEGGSPLRIQREAFLEPLLYLVEHQHGQDSPCEIRSNQLDKEAGPLCRATRAVNSGTRVINYIVPMLATTNLVAFRNSRPNAVWLS